ncbi:hypothetical protein EZV62_015945 [Acer yangbiense]|uniref:Uncharacterized protein n=1 Tax=Acer yangbiense TaxID=1000413 RepID=A0A5C7HP87_9ROSI|nr:hypothetical protein EZV62_015945 [Acer yangbiense]
MTRKKVDLAWIVDDRVRKASLKKMRAGLTDDVAMSAESRRDNDEVPEHVRDGAEKEDDRSRDLPTKRVMALMNSTKPTWKLLVGTLRRSARRSVGGLHTVKIDLSLLIIFRLLLTILLFLLLLLIKDNIGESDVNHHGSAQIEPAQCKQWFAEFYNNTDNITMSNIMAKTDHMFRLSASYQPWMAHDNYKSYFGGSNNDETIMGMYPHRDFRGLMSTGGTDIPCCHLFLCLNSQHDGGSSSGRNDFPIGLQPHHGGLSGIPGNQENYMIMAPPPSHFEGSGNRSDIGMQPNRNAEFVGNVNGGDSGVPLELFGGNINTTVQVM